MSPTVSFVLALLSALPDEIAAIDQAFTTVKSALAASDQATVAAILAALDSRTDADVAQVDADAAYVTGATG